MAHSFQSKFSSRPGLYILSRPAKMRGVAKIVSVAMCGLIVSFLLYSAVVAPIHWNHVQRRQGISALSLASAEEERIAAVGHLGLSQTYPDGSWIAIFYADIHAGRIQSVAIVRDSEDNWLESTHHFCGSFSAARRWFALFNDPETIPDPASMGDAYSILSATSLAEAHHHVNALGFTSFTP